MPRRTGEYPAIGSDERNYTVEEWTTFIPVPNFNDPNAEVPDLKVLRTSCGRELDRLDQGVYQIRGTSIFLRSTDPNAP